ncbi:MAG TPA: response regulator [Methanobacterium sp.]|nr:response regulator [Methanobacterium sp.]
MDENYTSVEILLVEDNPADTRLIFEVLKDFKIKNNLNVVTDGVKAMDYLNKEGKYCDSPTPDLILLDLNLPRKDGREVLKEIKQDDRFVCIPIVILTTSSTKEDILNAYKNHANCFITKPVDFKEFMRVINSIEDFWLSIVKLPSPKEYY